LVKGLKSAPIFAALFIEDGVAREGQIDLVAEVDAKPKRI
jgi:hypothetical protein